MVQTYLISSINHHISIVHARIHTKFIDYVSDNGPQAVDPDASKQPWYGLRTQRSQWFDLFNADDRIQAMRGIWAIMGRGGTKSDI